MREVAMMDLPIGVSRYSQVISVPTTNNNYAASTTVPQRFNSISAPVQTSVVRPELSSLTQVGYVSETSKVAAVMPEGLL
jgi:hypothetical protein